MSVLEATTKQLLPKPPRLLPDGSGYDWREIDRWFQKIYLLLGAPSNPDAFNITTTLVGLDTKVDKTTTINGHALDKPVITGV